MTDALDVDALGDEGAQAVELTAYNIVAVNRGRTNGNVDMSADQGSIQNSV